jgi:hypothetical protein
VLQRLARAMRALRPVVETGYENILLARMCIEQVGALQSEQSFAHIAGLYKATRILSLEALDR